jgi:hypothetical protein
LYWEERGLGGETATQIYIVYIEGDVKTEGSPPPAEKQRVRVGIYRITQDIKQEKGGGRKENRARGRVIPIPPMDDSTRDTEHALRQKGKISELLVLQQHKSSNK